MVVSIVAILRGAICNITRTSPGGGTGPVEPEVELRQRIDVRVRALLGLGDDLAARHRLRPAG